MHLTLLLLTVSIALLLRWYLPIERSECWMRWQAALTRFVLPPLLLLSSAIAVRLMGMHGQMWGLSVGWLGCHLALGFLLVAVALLLLAIGLGWRSKVLMQQYETIQFAKEKGAADWTAYLLPTTELFAAQVGVWRSQLVVSQGLLDTLNPEQLEAVLMHEQAHAHFRDPFWFFWLGWLRRLTAWLPNTTALWQELLLLREMRADRWAAQSVDPLLLAESLLLMVQSQVRSIDQAKAMSSAESTLMRSTSCCAALGEVGQVDRLEERIAALLAESRLPASSAIEVQSGDWSRSGWSQLLIGFFPLVTVLFHC